MAWNQSQQDSLARKVIARSFQDAIVDTLVIKCRRAIKQTGERRLVVAGGVGANLALQKALNQLMMEEGGGVFFPKQEFCTDNGAMVAYAGCLHLMKGQRDSTLSIKVQARWPLAKGSGSLE